MKPIHSECKDGKLATFIEIQRDKQNNLEKDIEKIKKARHNDFLRQDKNYKETKQKLEEEKEKHLKDKKIKSLNKTEEPNFEDLKAQTATDPFIKDKSVKTKRVTRASIQIS